MNQEMYAQIRDQKGFIAALDQSGGSTPKALALYGVLEDAYTNETEMFDRIHEMRSRMIKSPAFSSGKVIGAILFERTVASEIDGKPTAKFLWENQRVVPFLKVDKGLADEEDGVQLMKPIDNLEEIVKWGVEQGIFGTKMRSVIHDADKDAIARVVAQQFDFAKTILAGGLIPIVEPEVDIHATEKDRIERDLLEAIEAELEKLPEGQQVMLKLTIPTMADRYLPLVEHEKVLRVVALSGGYNRTDSCVKLSENHGVIASFSRALSEGLTVSMSDEEFDAAMKESIDAIAEASAT